jgi:tetratricopeptide (TPR) repeat protein
MAYARRAQTLFLMLLLAGCLSATVGGQFLAGRRGLLVGDPESALAYLSAVADQNPNYVNVIENYRESVWTYLGRAQYETKRYAEARKSLERAMATDAEPSMAKLYLGLTFLRTGDAAQGVKEVEAGMKGLYDWIEYMNRSRPFQAYWDPTYQIRKTIDQSLATIGGKDSNLENLMADGEWVGKKFEEELDKVRDDERRQLQRDFDRRSGGSFGFGIGF